MNILIIGCGYVGLALIPLLQTLPANISVTTRQESRIEQLSQVSAKVHVIDSPSSITEVIPNYDIVIFSVAAASRDEYESAYLQNAKAIVAGLQKSDRKQQLIYTSSTSVYGDHEGGWVDESSNLKPMNSQAEILVETEETLLKASSSSKKICIFRLGGITGPGRSIEERIIRSAGSTFPGDGMNYTNLSPVEVIVSGIHYAIEQDLEGVYNLCEEKHLLRKDLYDQICSENKLPPIKWDPGKSNFHAGNKRVSSEKFNNLKKVGI